MQGPAVFAFRQLAIPLASLGERPVMVNPHPGLDTRFPGIDFSETLLDDGRAGSRAVAQVPGSSGDRFSR
jgi:hypothetical protein